MFYEQRSPTQSTTSLSGDEDDDLNRSTFFPPTSPATWSSRHRLGRSGVRTPPHSPASHLPPELLINIFKHLNSSSDIYHSLLVSRAWCECSVELLWHKPAVPDFRSLMKIVRAISREDASFAYATFIRRLNFISVAKDISDAVLSRLASCTRLERLTLVGCNGLSDDVIASTLPNFTELVAVDLSGVACVTDQTVEALARNCPKLQGVNLLNCKHVTSQSVTALARSCPLLRRVKLSGTSDLTDEPISTLALRAPLVLEIDLGGCKQITDGPVRDIWLHSHHMRELRLAGCDKLTNTAFPAPPYLIHDIDLPHEGEGFLPLRMPRVYEQLRMLDLTGCTKLTDEAIEGIVAAAPKLRNLALTKCKSLTDRAIEAICVLGKNLHYVHLGHVSQITDRSVKSLVRSCTRLRYIDLANCQNLTDMSVFEIASLPKLRRVGLVRVPNLTDEAIYALGDQHQCLERVHLSYCDQITVMAVHFLLQKLQKLNHLSLTGVPAFRKQELQAYCRPPPADFSTPQRQAFCVYSGEGVKALRGFLAELFNSINDDMSSTDYEEEEEYDDEETLIVHEEHGYRLDDAMDIEVDHRPPAPMPLHPMVRGESHSRTSRQASHPLPASQTPSSSAVHAQPVAGPSVVTLPTLRTSDPPRSSGASPAPSDGSALSSGAFFRTFALDGSSPLADGTRHGALTPELVFAEIGHGRGISAPQSSGWWADAPQATPMTAPAYGAFPGRTNGYVNGHAAYAPYQESEHDRGGPAYPGTVPRSAGVARASRPISNGNAAMPHGNAAMPHSTPPNGTSNNVHHGMGNGSHHTVYNGAALGTSANGNGVLANGHSSNVAERGRAANTKVLHEASHSHDSGTGTGSGTSSGRGGVKRALRNTFNAVEHHASSFFFGRATHEDSGIESRDASRTRLGD